jgi:cell fate (sporulation/competence/biofilm development) regulator YlbF (YheA/YmcA/DUF963 family)
MADVEDLVQKARALGTALAAHPVVRAHYEAQRAVRTDAGAQQLLREYQAHIDRLHQLEAGQMPIEVADKQKLKTFEQQMAAQDSLKRLMRTQTDYVALMNRINSEIDGPLASLAEPAA